MSGQFYVYAHKRADTGRVFYVGKGKDRRAYNRSGGRSEHWKRIVAKHGLLVAIVRDGLSEADAFAQEIELIDFLRSYGASLCNISIGGSGASGFTQSTESNEKRAASLRGRSRPPEVVAKMANALRGIKRSAEFSLKNSAAHLGKRRSAESRQRMGDARCGMTFSDSHRKNIGLANLRRPKFAEHQANMTARAAAAVSKPITCVDDGMSYRSISAAASATGIPASRISMVCSGKASTAGGKRWVYT